MIAFAVGTVAISYRTGRAHAAWRDVSAARRDLPRKRRIAWSHTRGLLFIALILIGTLSAASLQQGPNLPVIRHSNPGWPML